MRTLAFVLMSIMMLAITVPAFARPVPHWDNWTPVNQQVIRDRLETRLYAARKGAVKSLKRANSYANVLIRKERKIGQTVTIEERYKLLDYNLSACVWALEWFMADQELNFFLNPKENKPSKYPTSLEELIAKGYLPLRLPPNPFQNWAPTRTIPPFLITSRDFGQFMGCLSYIVDPTFYGNEENPDWRGEGFEIIALGDSVNLQPVVPPTNSFSRDRLPCGVWKARGTRTVPLPNYFYHPNTNAVPGKVRAAEGLAEEPAPDAGAEVDTPAEPKDEAGSPDIEDPNPPEPEK